MIRYICLLCLVLLFSYFNSEVSTNYIHFDNEEYVKYYKEKSKGSLTEDEYKILKEEEIKIIARSTTEDAMRKSAMYFSSVYSVLSLLFCFLYYFSIRFFIHPKRMIDCLFGAILVFIAGIFFISLFESAIYAFISFVSLYRFKKIILRSDNKKGA